MSYTKGEWKLIDDGISFKIIGPDITWLHNSCSNTAEHKKIRQTSAFLEQQANARLIAAAPKLLEACILALDRLGRIYPEHAVVCKLPVDECPTKKAIDKLKTAIAEAEKAE